MLSWIQQVDESVVRTLNSSAHRWPAVYRGVALAAGGLASAEVLLMFAIGLRGHPGAVARMLAAVGGIYALSELLGRAVPRSRPFASLSDVSAVLGHASERSFPSRHVASAVAMAQIGRQADPRLGRWMTWVAGCLAAARVGAGLHYPSDALAGALLGVFLTRAFDPPSRRQRFRRR